jgi:signal transduction histidine kinase/ligand-binding sensor domain-containing protein
MMAKRATLMGVCLFACLTAQQPRDERRVREAGAPFIRWFSPQEYGGSQQVWSFEQDQSGVLYAGLSNGLRQFDGSSWRVIETPHNAPVRGLALGPSGRIYVGEVGDFGYLEPDAVGNMVFRSLLEFVPQADRDFQDVRKIHTTPEGIYFQSLERLFLLTTEGEKWRTKVWKPATRFRNSFLVQGSLYVTVTGVGLHRLDGEKLEKIPAGDLEQTPETSIAALLPHGESPSMGQLLVGTGNGRLQLLDDKGLHPFPVEDGPWSKLGISGGGAILLSDGGIGVGTRGGGFLMLEHNGKVRGYLDRSTGIPSDGVLGVYRDRHGTVWLGLQNGIAKVEEESPFSEFARPQGMSAAVNAIARYRGVLHVATFAGLKYLVPETREFRAIQGIESAGIVGLLVHGDRLLATAGRDGLFEVTGHVAKPVAQSSLYLSMASSRQDPQRIWLGTRAGLASMRWEGRWVDEGMIASTPEVRSIVEPEPGVLWLGTQAQGVVRIRFRGNSRDDPEVKRFGKADGLPGDGGVSVHLAAGRLIFASPTGVRELDSANDRFVQSKLLGMIPTGGSAEEYSVAPDRQGNIWVNFGLRPVVLMRQPDGSYQADENQLRRIGDGRVLAMHADDDGVVWMGGLDHLFRYDPAKVRPGKDVAPALIRRVTVGDKQKTVLFAGSSPKVADPIAFKDNEVRFEYAMASFDDPSRNQFQSKLEGFDRDWSAWTTETRRDYTNLPPGSYTFQLRSKNLAGQEGAPAEYPLQILPPWYRTWWAYGLYALAAMGALFATDRVLRRRVVARERERSVLREAELRAETAAAQAKTLQAENQRAQAENERNKNVQMLSEIGKELTSSLDLDTIFYKLYEHVNRLTDATIFGVGIYHEDRHEIDYRLAMENGKRYPAFSRDTQNPNQLTVWCIERRRAVVMNDVTAEYSQYVSTYEDPRPHLHDGTERLPVGSLVSLPLMMKDRVLGVMTVQSLSKGAYTAYHVDLLQNLASYTSIAIDNADAYLHLKTAQDQLLVQEKLASLGALTAGIAHEIKNPLNFVNNFAELSVELMEELGEELQKLETGGEPDLDNVKDLMEDLTGNARKITEHGKRADGIVKSMLLHSRGEGGERQPTDINAMLDENVSLSYHGMRAQDSSFNVTIERQYASDLGKVVVIAQDLSRVFLNILNNACYAANDKLKKVGSGYCPTLRVRTVNLGDAIEVRIRDNGMGIPPEVRAKIFNPFFTTKPTGQGTGLGLSISHDIVVQEHGGQLEVDTVAGEFTEFIVRLPRHWRKSA